jgi:DNA (cytosine-5)-methyltransferase 1
MKIEAIDLFCGAGGLTRGLLDAGVTVKAGFDIDANCRYAYEANNKGAKFHAADVALVTAANLNDIWTEGAIRLLAGCAPCQPFSSASNAMRSEKRANDDEAEIDDDKAENELPIDKRYNLLDHFGRLVWGSRPHVVTMENVPSVQGHAPFKRFVERLKRCKYEVWYQNVECTKVGLPQTRRRLVLLASRLGTMDGLKLPAKAKAPTVLEAIGKLPPLAAGGKDPNDPIHFSRSLTPINLSRIKASTPGGTWADWPKALRSKCHTKASGASYQSVYARMSADKPSPTITTQFFNFGTGRFGHPVQDRALTPREAAMLQSFPEAYEFVKPGEPITMVGLGLMIGNAVPPKLGQAIGNTVIEHVKAAAEEFPRNPFLPSIRRGKGIARPSVSRFP